ncbi:hypothetical protein [Myceligenerans crystallogenes]|uniref:Uncharacterized protein n=1 Tax=Myceligenerans crystallogenes TaxID=316335 RepID=A0ABN2NEU9_9MICO
MTRVHRGGALAFLTLLAVLAAVLVVPGASGFGAAGGSSGAVSEARAAVPEGPVVLIGTTGIRWRDLTGTRGDLAPGEVAVAAPFLAGLLDGGRARRAPADVAALSLTTGAAARCPAGGWLALSAAGPAESSAARDAPCGEPRTDQAAVAGTGACPGEDRPRSRPGCASGGTVASVVTDWQGWQGLQRRSAYGARLGRLGEALDGVCTTAIGPGAAIALARADGSVGRYAERAAPGRFGCPVTVVDAGSALLTAAEVERDDAGALRAVRVAAVDNEVRRVLDAVPDDATVVIADLANQVERQPELGVGLVLRPMPVSGDAVSGDVISDDAVSDDSVSGDAGAPGYLTSSATRTTGVARAADLPGTLLAAAGLPGAGGIEATPLLAGEARPAAGAEAADALADLTERDHARRGAYTVLVGAGFWVALALAAACWWAGARARRRLLPVPPRWRRAARGAALFLGALPAAGFLASLTGWWRFPAPSLALGLAVTAIAGLVAGAVALLPGVIARPAGASWPAPGVLAGLTFVVLTVDGLLDTPLNRAAPLGAAPSYGARFYGFGNPTFCVYAVAAIVLAGAVAQWLVSRGRRGAAALAVAGIGAVALVVDVLPRFGADLGGGPALVPAFAVLGIAAYGGRAGVWRIAAVTAGGVLLVAAVGVVDWLRPEAERSHLGRFVADVVDGEAWALLARKAGYALRSVLAGPSVWVAVLVLVAVAVVLFTAVPGRRIEPLWSRSAREAWPLLRPTAAAIWLVAVAGSFVNDFGLRIAVLCLLVALPWLTLASLRQDGVRHEQI